jgi:hypothetical protein
VSSYECCAAIDCELNNSSGWTKGFSVRRNSVAFTNNENRLKSGHIFFGRGIYNACTD